MDLRNSVRVVSHGFLILFTVLLFATSASAASDGGSRDTLSGEEIIDLIAGNTVTGSMSSGQSYAEFYAEDGTIRGDGYTGSWSVDGDEMCFDYGEDVTCYQVSADGQSLQWILDGKVDGTGTVREGNPMDF